ncbi:MAG: YebC/PmpR family DNA-binding transcriptional regulator [Sedimentisphaerales bacterium]|nr:YebC/PmpR family DNA-binding transcriptional regulator [Sedimentisphaerales bacterium]
MSGHSHWAGIKYKKAVIDAKRGKVWSKVARMIIVAAKNGGGDPSANLALRYAIDKGKAANMPKDTIEKAVKKGTGDLEGVSFEEVLYEGYGPSGVAVMVSALTDNRNRTGPEIKKIFEKHGGTLGARGSVNRLFNQKGLITVNIEKIGEDKLMEIALNAGAEDVKTEGNISEITCAPSEFETLKKAMLDNGIATEIAEISMIPLTTVQITDQHTAGRIVSLMDAFDDHDDVQNAYSNFDIPDEIMSKIS